LKHRLEVREDLRPTPADGLNELRAAAAVHLMNDGEFLRVARRFDLDRAARIAFRLQLRRDLVLPLDDDALRALGLEDFAGGELAAIARNHGPRRALLPGRLERHAEPIELGEFGFGYCFLLFFFAGADVSDVNEFVSHRRILPIAS